MTSKNRTPRRIVILAGIVAAAAVPTAFAQGVSGFISPYDETLSITLGGIVNRFDSNVRFDSDTREGTDLQLEDNLLKKNLSSVEAGLTWRFFRAHRLDLEYFTANRSGSRAYTSSITIGDTTYPVGANVSLEAKSQLFAADYRWSFSQQPTVEWALLLGLYGGQLKYDLDAVGGVAGTGGGTVTRETHKTVSTTVPLPMIGVSVDWYPDPQWRAGAMAMGVKAKIGDVDGHAYRLGAYGEWLFARNWGVGARYGYVDINADVTKSDFNGSLGWRTNSVSLYAKAVW